MENKCLKYRSQSLVSKHFGRRDVEVVIKLDFRSNLNQVIGKTLYSYGVTLQPAGVLMDTGELADLSSGYRPRTVIERGTTKSIQPPHRLMLRTLGKVPIVLTTNQPEKTQHDHNTLSTLDLAERSQKALARKTANCGQIS